MEQELAGARGIFGACAEADGKFGIGAEIKYVNESTTDNRTGPEQKFHIGPSVQ